MNKKFISIMIAIVLTITMIIPALGAAGDDNVGDDNTPWNISISNSKLLGSYELGTSKEFQLEYYPSGSVGLKIIRHLEITGDGEISDFEYYEKGQWNDISKFETEMTFTTTAVQRARVTFHEAGVYTVRFWATSPSGEELVVSKRDISVSNEGIALYVESETSTEPVTDEPTTKAQPTESTSAEPSTKKITETTTAKVPAATKKVAKTKIKKTTKKKSAKKVKISLKKVKKAYGYEIKISTSSKFKKKKTITKITKKTSCTVKKLKPGKKYYVKARAFVKNGKDSIYSDWCKKKTVKFTK